MSRPPRSLLLFAVLSILLALGAGSLLLSREGQEMDVILERVGLVAALRASAIDVEMEAARSDALVWSTFGNLRTRAARFAGDWAALGNDAGAALARLYVTDNPYPKGERHLLMDAGDGSRYSSHHAEFHPAIEDFLRTHDYYDLFLVLPGGEVAYTYFKEEDFATNLLEGPWRDSGLASAVQTALTLEEGGVAFSEFAPYGPSGDEWAAFFAGPLPFPDGRTGALAFQITPERVGRQLASISGTRGTVLTTLVGPEITIHGEAPWSLPTPSDPESLAQQALARVAQGQRIGSGVMVDADGSAWAVAWEVLSLGADDYVTLSRADLSVIKAGFRPQRWAILMVSLLLWAALATLTLGAPQRFALERHEI